jgi:hypothetical protein
MKIYYSPPTSWTGGATRACNISLYIVLIDLAARKPLASDRFLMTAGIGSGSLLIPDTLENGEYLVIAYTNGMRDGDSGNFFRRQIDIRSVDKPAFNLAVSLLPKIYVEDSIRLTGKVGTDYGGIASGGNLQYTIAGDGQLLQTGNQIIDQYGEVHITLPAKDTLATSLLLTAEISRDSRTTHSRTPLILTPDQV